MNLNRLDDVLHVTCTAGHEKATMLRVNPTYRMQVLCDSPMVFWRSCSFFLLHARIRSVHVVEWTHSDVDLLSPFAYLIHPLIVTRSRAIITYTHTHTHTHTHMLNMQLGNCKNAGLLVSDLIQWTIAGYNQLLYNWIKPIIIPLF